MFNKKFPLAIVTVLTVLFCVFCSMSFVSCSKNSKNDSKTSIEKSHKKAKSQRLSEMKKSNSRDVISSENEGSYTVKNISTEDFLLSAKKKSEIADYIAAWNSDYEQITENEDFFDELKIYPLDLKYSPAEIEKPVIYLFTPEYSSKCSFGFCDENAEWISKNAYIAIFSQQGNLLAVSSDYTISSSFFDVQLENEELYYVLVMKSYQNEGETSVNLRIVQNVRADF